MATLARTRLIVVLFAAPMVTAMMATTMAVAAPAHADPASANTTTVEMTMPGPAPQPGQSVSDAYQPAPVVLTEQDGGGGVDRDGTDGRITGPLISAIPAVRAEPAPLSPRIRS